ncbi:dethiobiotin synthase [Aeoliella sp. SH292]|uniref:dethiobiotin synthase n=1 Tax=Aeoliella sp. SH292 TaxID=3454464 RepID=UPI003F9A0DCD
MRGFFITGTGTEVGKTYVGALLARELTSRGFRVGVYKPVASGCVTLSEFQASGRREASGEVEVEGTGGWGLGSDDLVSEDALELWQAAGQPLSLNEVCPQRFRAAVAPNVAARMEDRRVDTNLLRIGIDPWLSNSDIVLVEGAGGLMSPISDDDYNADLAADLGLPLIIVAANRLGVINDTLQTVITASVFGDGLEVAGVVLNSASEAVDDESLSTNAEQLREHLRVPVLGEVSYGGAPSVATIVDALLSRGDA